MRRVFLFILLIIVINHSWATPADQFEHRLQSQTDALLAEQNRHRSLSRVRTVSLVGLVAGLAGSLAGWLVWSAGDDSNNSNWRDAGNAISGVSLLGVLPVSALGVALGETAIYNSRNRQLWMQNNIRRTEGALKARAQDIPVQLQRASLSKNHRSQDVTIDAQFENVSDTGIKYIYFATLPYNRVSEVLTGERPQEILRFGEIVGPVDPGRNVSHKFVTEWDFDRVEFMRVEGIHVVFDDDTTWTTTDSMLIAETLSIDERYTESVARASYRPSFDVFEGIEAASPLAHGSGFFVSDSGHFVTNYHVIQDYSSVAVYVEGVRYDATVIIEDRRTDLAVLLVSGLNPGEIIPLKVEDRQAAIGEDVFTMGFPNPEIQGRSPKLTNGTVSSDRGFQDDPQHYQVSVPVQPGNSGGPLVTSRGVVTGVIVSRLSDIGVFQETGSLPQNVNYAIKSTRLVPLLRDIGLDATGTPDRLDDNNVGMSGIYESVRRSIGQVIVNR